MHIETNVSSGLDAHAIEALFAPLYGRAPDFLVVSCSSEFEMIKVATEVSKVDAHAVHGLTSCLGVMGNSGMVGKSGDGIGYFAIWDETGAFGSAGVKIRQSAASAAREATELALQRAGRPGEAPELVWVSASPGQEEAIIAGIESVIGSDIPIVGGSAADNTVAGNWSVFGTDGVLSDGVQISVLFPSRPVAADFQSGYAPTGKSARVTRAEGRRLYTLDDRPASDVYQEFSGLTFPNLAVGETSSVLSTSSFNPMGVKLDDVADVPYFLLMHAAVLHGDGSIEFFADVQTGDDLHMMSGSPDSLTSRAGRVASQSRQRVSGANKEPAGALVIYCAGCMLSITDQMDEVAAAVDRSLSGAPFLGIFTFGEQGHALNQKNSHGNLMISCVSFSA